MIGQVSWNSSCSAALPLSAYANADHGDDQEYDSQYDGELKEGPFHAASGPENGNLPAEDAAEPCPFCLKQDDYDENDRHQYLNKI